MSNKKKPILQPTIKHILCPIDLPLESNQSIIYAIALAQTYQAKLFVCYCPQNNSYNNNHFKVWIEDILKSQLGNYEFASFAWDSHLLTGYVADSICDTAEDLKADLIIMQSRRRPYSAALFGSTTEDVCQKAHCTVLVTHSDEQPWINSKNLTLAPKKILLASDFSKCSNLALTYAVSIAENSHSELHLLNVLPDSIEMKENKHHLLANSIKQLQQLVPAKLADSNKIFWEALIGEPSSCILQYAKENEIDLLCMGAHANKQTGSLIWGTTVDQVIRLSLCSTLITR